jgi:hypothetical protein
VRARAFALLLVAACSKRAPSGDPAAPAPESEPTATAPSQEQLDVPSPNGTGPLVPWMPASAWHGQGIPPKQFSLFAVPEGSPVLGYAALDRDACEGALRKRGIPFRRAEETGGVRAPIRLDGALHGVGVHSPLPPAQRANARAELIDCRLALALDDFAATLAPRGIVDVTHVSAYRSRSEGGCTVKYPGEQHCAALAVDVASFTKRDGTKLVVERDFHGRIGLLTCSEPARNELWEIACASAGRQFQVVLTPNWNAEHKNHLHLELTIHDWVLVR